MNSTAVLWIAGVGLTALTCKERTRPLPEGLTGLLEEHTALGASFVSRDSAALRRLLHPDLIVQPPAPDSAQQGEAAVEYLLGLAAQTAVVESRLQPRSVVPEGPFALEQGIWTLKSGDRVLWSPYTLRWRAAPEGWQVVLLRWAPFR